VSEHNQQDQKVGNQYNADAINVHNHGSSPAEAPHHVEQTRQALQEFKDGFAKTGLLNLRLRLLEAEDLLIHIIGQQRYVSLKQDAEFIEDKLKADVWAFGHGDNSHALLQQGKVAFEALKARIAGIEYRK
jgi:hypothetical protein